MIDSEYKYRLSPDDYDSILLTQINQELTSLNEFTDLVKRDDAVYLLLSLTLV